MTGRGVPCTVQLPLCDLGADTAERVGGAGSPVILECIGIGEAARNASSR